MAGRISGGRSDRTRIFVQEQEQGIDGLKFVSGNSVAEVRTKPRV
jgi:hypothetical protein